MREQLSVDTGAITKPVRGFITMTEIEITINGVTVKIRGKDVGSLIESLRRLVIETRTLIENARLIAVELLHPEEWKELRKFVSRKAP